jgi:tetratricopeptide (TPR) repeat protein
MFQTPSWSVPRSFVCSTLALVLGAAPSASALAAAPGKSSKKTEAEAAPSPSEPSSPSDDDPEALSAAAVDRFEARDYDAAVVLFEKAYAADPNPNYLFNIGRVYEEKGDLKKAIVYYQRFVGQSGVDLESRQTATERLKVLREALAQLDADEPSRPSDEPDDVVAQPDEALDPSTATDDDASAAKRKKTLRITGYALMGAGGVGLIVGGVFGGLASSSVDDAQSDPFVDRQEAFRDRARTQARVADAMFITGGVLAAAGLVLVLTTLGKGKKKQADTAKAVWSPVVGPQQVGVVRRF